MSKSVILTSSLRIMVSIIKVVGDFCNLRCRYCFYNTEDQSTPHMMSDELLEKFLAEYMKLFSGHLVFIWHGGEPLLAGLPFFHKVVQIQSKNIREGQTIQNSIQTNATLIDNEWAEFFKAHNFRVGVSLDGDKKSHNHFRMNQGGCGSFNMTMRGIAILRQHGIRPGIIQTLTHDNVARSKEDFHFLANVVGAQSWGTNTYLDTEGINRAMFNQSISNNDLTEFLKTCIDLWLEQNDPNLRIREIENFVAGILGKKAPGCAFNGSCTGYFCLEYDGRIYPCDRSSVYPELLLGNLSQQSLLEVLNSSARLKYSEDVNSLPSECLVCEWQKACHNGCAMQRVGGIRGKYYYCETRRAVFSYLKEKIEAQKQPLAT